MGNGGELPSTAASLTLGQRDRLIREIAERCLSHMGQQDFQVVLDDCHLAGRAIIELLDRTPMQAATENDR